VLSFDPIPEHQQPYTAAHGPGEQETAAVAWICEFELAQIAYNLHKA
jgi:hypothetical protein